MIDVLNCTYFLVCFYRSGVPDYNIHTVWKITNIKTETTTTKDEKRKAERGKEGCQSRNIIYLLCRLSETMTIIVDHQSQTGSYPTTHHHLHHLQPPFITPSYHLASPDRLIIRKMKALDGYRNEIWNP